MSSLPISHLVLFQYVYFFICFGIIDVINKQIDQFVQETLKELEKKNEELELANNELDHFVYSASHDLKAPLSSILGLINITKYEVKDDKVLDYFVRIENRVERLTHFIKDVIEISRNARTDIKAEPIEFKFPITIGLYQN